MNTHELDVLREAADEAKKLVKMFSSVKTVADAFERVASMENLVKEVEGRLAKAHENEAAEYAKLGKIKTEAERIIVEAEFRASALIAAAEKEAEIILKEASRKLAKLGEASRAEAEKLAAVDVEIKQKQTKTIADLDETLRAIEHKTEELRVLDDKIAAAKDAIQQMLK